MLFQDASRNVYRIDGRHLVDVAEVTFAGVRMPATDYAAAVGDSRSWTDQRYFGSNRLGWSWRTSPPVLHRWLPPARDRWEPIASFPAAERILALAFAARGVAFDLWLMLDTREVHYALVPARIDGPIEFARVVRLSDLQRSHGVPLDLDLAAPRLYALGEGRAVLVADTRRPNGLRGVASWLDAAAPGIVHVPPIAPADRSAPRDAMPPSAALSLGVQAGLRGPTHGAIPLMVVGSRVLFWTHAGLFEWHAPDPPRAFAFGSGPVPIDGLYGPNFSAYIAADGALALTMLYPEVRWYRCADYQCERLASVAALPPLGAGEFAGGAILGRDDSRCVLRVHDWALDAP